MKGVKMTYQLWDKISPIYNVTAEQAMINNPLYGTEDSYLFLQDDGSIYDILPISTIRAAVDGDGKTDAEVCEAYIVQLTELPEPEGSLEELTAKVASLEEQLAAAKILLGVE